MAIDPFIIFAFLCGACVGSFLNVCIYRLPAGKSVVFPGSSCPACENRIRFYDNLPLISWFTLRGRCRHCATPIHWRYLLVEALGACMAVALYIKYGPTAEAVIYFTFTAALLVVTFIDLDHRIIPDRITLPGIPLAFAAALWLPRMSWSQSLIGILSGGGSLLLVAVVYGMLTGKEGMGGGDIKLLAMIGALTGWQGVLFTVLTGSAIGTLIGVSVMLYRGKNMKLAIPFGPFLSAGAIGFIFCGHAVLRWYFGLYH